MRRHELAPSGTTGNATLPAGTGLELDGDPDDVGYEFIVEAAGATPAVTFKFQGSLDGVNWYDIGYITEAVSTEAFAARSVTPAVPTSYAQWRGNALRRYRYNRVVVTGNVNITWRAALVEFD